MRTIIALLLTLSFFFVAACNQTPKDMTLKDFAKIENEILDTDMKDSTKEKIAKKYGYTLKQYSEMEEKVSKDVKLQEEIGNIRMKNPKSLKK